MASVHSLFGEALRFSYSNPLTLIPVINCIRLLTRLLPYIFEDSDWRGYFWSALPSGNPSGASAERKDDLPLAKALLNALTDLLYCPDFTVAANTKKGPVRFMFHRLYKVCCFVTALIDATKVSDLMCIKYILFTDSNPPKRPPRLRTT